MKLTTRHSPATGPYFDNASPYEAIVETEDGKESFEIYEGEPEDMTFGRNLSAVFSIPDLVRAAYVAGRRGEDFEYIDEDYEF